MARKIKKYINDEISKMVDNNLSEWKKNRNIMIDPETNEVTYIRCVFFLFNDFASLHSLIPDIYLLARIFKGHDIERSPYKGATKYDQPRDSHNIIIYASYERSRLYRDFLNFMDFKMISSTLRDPHYSKSNTCLDMRHFPMPFFSQSAINKYDIDNGLLDDVIMSLKKF